LRRRRSAPVAKLASHCTRNRQVEISVVEDDEWRIAAQLHRRTLDRIRTLLYQQLADFRRACEGELCERSSKKFCNSFTYTLLESRDFEG
jgi:hypothetical protein